MIGKVKKNDIFIFLLINLVLFQAPLMYLINDAFGYIDELLAVIAVIELFRTIQKPMDSFTAKYIVILAAYITVTTVANFNAGLVENWNVIFKGMILFLRNFVILMGAYRSRIKVKNSFVRILPFVIKEIKIMLWLALLFWPINLISNIGMSYDVRFGIKSYAFIFHHPGNLVTYFFLTLLIICFFSDKCNYKGVFTKKFYVNLNIFILLTSLRYSVVIAIGIYMYYLLLESKRVNRIIKILVTIAVPAIVLYFIYPQFNKYFLSGDTPRLLFYRYAFITLQEYLFGTGFATYGSYMAQVNYSPLYVKYGFSRFYGMSAEDPMFLFDNFWPMILVESGILGTICAVLWFLLMIKKAYVEKNTMTTIIIMFFLVMTVAGQTLIHFSSVGFFALIGFSMSSELSYKQIRRQIDEKNSLD